MEYFGGNKVICMKIFKVVGDMALNVSKLVSMADIQTVNVFKIYHKKRAFYAEDKFIQSDRAWFFFKL